VNVILDIDGPRDHEYVLEVAEALAESVRVLNHLTRDHGSIRYPSEADVVIRHLAAAASRWPQLLSQIGGWLAAEQQAARIEMARGTGHEGRPAVAVIAAGRLLDEAAGYARQVQAALDDAAHLTNDMAAAGAEGEDG
jgi:hypothetical protein